MLRRFVTGLVSAAILIAAMWMPSRLLCWALVIIAVWGVTEMLDAFQKAGHQPIRWSSYITLAFLVPARIIIGTRAATPVLTLILMLTTLNIAIRRRPSWIDAAASLYAAFTVALPLLMLMDIDMLENPPGRWMVFASFVIPLSGDTFAYYIGSTLGRHKLNPMLSPNKTWEGAAGGLAGSAFGAFLLGAIGARFAPLPPISHWILLGIFGGLAGQLGDFSASLVKRWCGIKDFGVVFPGHGGIMDRFDSVLFTVYIIYVYTYIIQPLFI